MPRGHPGQVKQTTKKLGNHGNLPGPGPGRPKGVPNKVNRDLKEALSACGQSRRRQGRVDWLSQEAGRVTKPVGVHDGAVQAPAVDAGGKSGRAAHRRARLLHSGRGLKPMTKPVVRKPGVYRDMETRRAYRRAWMAAARARASTRSGEAAARKKEPVAANPQKSNRAIAAETGVAFKTIARARASGVSNDTPEKTIGLDGKSYPEGRPKIRIPNNWAPRDYQMNVWRYLERGGKRAICVWHRRAGKDDVCLHWAAASWRRPVGPVRRREGFFLNVTPSCWRKCQSA
jgi:hypothetical protein